jgi:hypothetical protein
MAVRLVVTLHAAPSKGAELSQAMKARCEVSRHAVGNARRDRLNWVEGGPSRSAFDARQGVTACVHRSSVQFGSGSCAWWS